MRDTHDASSVVDVLRVATDGGARELVRVVLGEAPGAAGGCAVVGAVDGARAANLFGEAVEDDSHKNTTPDPRRTQAQTVEKGETATTVRSQRWVPGRRMR